MGIMKFLFTTSVLLAMAMFCYGANGQGVRDKEYEAGAQKFAAATPPTGQLVWQGMQCPISRVANVGAGSSGILTKVTISSTATCPSGTFVSSHVLEIEQVARAQPMAQNNEQGCELSCRSNINCIVLIPPSNVKEPKKSAWYPVPQYCNVISEMLRSARLAFQRSILSNLKVEQWVTIDQLTANAFLYQGKVVGTNVSFEQMISASEAVFVAGMPRIPMPLVQPES
jgi:hypothetical protein